MLMAQSDNGYLLPTAAAILREYSVKFGHKELV